MGELLRPDGRAQARRRDSRPGGRGGLAGHFPLCTRPSSPNARRSEKLEKGAIGDVNLEIEKLRLAARRLELAAPPADVRSRQQAAIDLALAARQAEYEKLASALFAQRAQLVAETAGHGGRRRHAQGDSGRGNRPRHPAQRDGDAGEARALRFARRRVRHRRAARVEHRGRHLSRDLRHRHDGLPDVVRGRAARRSGRALPARVRQAGAPRAHRAHRGQQSRRRAVDRLRRLRTRLLRLHRRRQHRPAVLPRGPADADLRHRRHSLGRADARAAHRAGGHRRDRGGSRRGARRSSAPARWRSARRNGRRRGKWSCRRRLLAS